MEDETDTLPSGGTDNVTPESDTAEEWDFFDPDEDQDTEETQETKATDEGAEETDADPEADADPETESPAQIAFPDGTQLPLDEVVKGYLRQSDYTRKAQEVSQKRQALDADLSIISGIAETFIDHLTKMVPQPPDFNLRMRDPVAAARMQAQHDAAMGRVQELIELGKKPKEITEGLSKTDKESLVAQENTRLAERFPEMLKPEGRQKFFENAATAAEEAGFSMDDLAGVTDHRLFVLAHWANVGMKAAKSRETARAKVANVPPATPRKPGQAAQTSDNAKAVQRFRKSPSLKSAAAAWDGN